MIDRLTFESLKRMIELGEAELGGGVDDVDVVGVGVGVGEGQRLPAWRFLFVRHDPV
jgi:hypothetical protein